MIRRLLLHSAFCTLHFSLVFPAFADEPILTLSESQHEYSLTHGSHVDVLPDPGGNLTIDDVSSPTLADSWRKNDLSGNVPERTFWLRIRIRNDHHSEAWVARTITVLFSDLEIYRPDRHHPERWERDRSGSLVPHNDQTVPYRLPAVTVSIRPGETCLVYLRVVRLGIPANQVPIVLEDLESFKRHARDDYLMQGIYFGLATVMVLYNLFLALSLRDRAYAYYVFYMLGLVLWSFTFNGLSQEFFYPEASWSVVRITFFILTFNWILGVRFAQTYLRTDIYTPRLHRAMWVLAIVHGSLHLLVAAGAMSPPPLIQFLNIVVIGVYLAAAIGAIRQGNRAAWYFLAGQGGLVIATFLSSLALVGVLPTSDFLLNIVQPAFSVEMILFSLGLADRINVLRAEREEQESLAREAERVSRETREQSERKSAFLASMAHELRTPLNAIKGFNSLVLRRAGDTLPDQQRDNLTKVDRASDHLLATINDLLDLSKIEAGRMDVNVTTFDIRQTILSACEVVSPLIQEGVELRHDIPDDIGEAHTDQQRLSQMLINLLSNAIKFTEAGSVCVTVSSLGAERSALSAGGEQLAIAVSDTGRGIPEHELPTLFDEYRQVEGQSESAVQSGTGLGLSITKRFAELLGGSISVESKVGAGSTFTLTIPLLYADQEANA